MSQHSLRSGARLSLAQWGFVSVTCEVRLPRDLMIDTPVATIRRGRAQSDWTGIVALAAFGFAAAIQEVWAAPPDGSPDYDSITYKDLPHGTYQVTTREPIPRTIIVDDPGQGFVVRPEGTGAVLQQFPVSPAEMLSLMAASR